MKWQIEKDALLWIEHLTDKKEWELAGYAPASSGVANGEEVGVVWRELSASCGQQFPERAGQGVVYLPGDALFVLLPDQAKIDDRKADSRQHDGEQPAVLEDLTGEVAMVGRAAEGAENDEDPPDEHHAGADQQQIDAAVEQF